MEQRICIGLSLAASLIVSGAVAQEVREPDPGQGFKFEPLMLEAKGSTGNVFGVNFGYKKSWDKLAAYDKLLLEKAPTRTHDAQDRGLMSCSGYAEAPRRLTTPTPEWVSFTDCAGEISAKGTATADANKNPNKLVDFSGSYSWNYTNSSRASTRMFALGGQAKYETDQSFENKQFVFGLRGTFTHLLGCEAGSVCSRMNFLGMSIGLQRVNPTKDTARTVTVVADPMDNYQRIEFDGFYKLYLPESWRYLSDIELNYRHFQELNPSGVISQAGLHRNRLGLVRINFGLGGKGSTAVDPSMFIQYSRGSLPFDTKSERVVKFGLQFQVF